MEKIELSECCHTEVCEGFADNPRDHHDPRPIYECTKCMQECEVIEVCAYCLGGGTISTDEADEAGHTMQNVGTKTCTACI